MSSITLCKLRRLPCSNQTHPNPYAAFEHFWSYAGKTAILCRHLLNAAARNFTILSCTSKDFPEKVKTITRHLQLLSIVSVPFSLIQLQSVAQKFFDSLKIDDRQGISLATLSFTVIAADIVDSITTCANAALALALSKPLISGIGLPLGFTMVTLGTISRTILIAKSFNLYKRTHAISDYNYRERLHLKTFLQEHLTSSNKIKKADLLRAAPPDVVKELEHVLTRLTQSFTDKNRNELAQSLQKIQGRLSQKMRIDLLGITANMIIFSALTLFGVGVVGSMPFLLLSLGFTTRLSSTLYQDLIRYRSK